MVTNDIFTKEDAEFLTRRERCLKTAFWASKPGAVRIRRSAKMRSHNQEALDDFAQAPSDVELMFVGSGGDNLAATFSPELADKVIYVIDVAAGDKIPRKGGPGDHPVRSHW